MVAGLVQTWEDCTGANRPRIERPESREIEWLFDEFDLDVSHVAKLPGAAGQVAPVAAPPGGVLRPGRHQAQRLLRKTVRAALEGQDLSGAAGEGWGTRPGGH